MEDALILRKIKCPKCGNIDTTMIEREHLEPNEEDDSEVKLPQVVGKGGEANDAEPPEDVGMTYTLTCENCQEIFYSFEAFPSPQLCSKCKNPDRVRVVKKILSKIIMEYAVAKFVSIDEVAKEICQIPVKVKLPVQKIKQDMVHNDVRDNAFNDGVLTQFNSDKESLKKQGIEVEGGDNV